MKYNILRWRNYRAILVVALGLVLSAATSKAQDSSDIETFVRDFDKFEIGALPQNWQTGVEQAVSEPAMWQIIADPEFADNQVISMETPDSGGLFGLFGRAFNIIWIDDTTFLNGTVEVKFRPVSGEKDQGGGLMWRVQDKDNYYLARFNPLEENFRIYFVHNGSRQELVSTSVRLSQHDWHVMKIVQRGNEFEGYIDGELLLKGASNLFRKAGAVGLWTKTDAVTWFDDLGVTLSD